MLVATVSNVNNNVRNLAFGEKAENTSTENKPKLSTQTKVFIGAGLTALAAVGIYLATKGKGKVKPQTLVDEVKNPTNNTQLEELQKQAKELKEKIKNIYFQRLNEKCPRISYYESIVSEKQSIISEFSSNLKNRLKALQNDPEYVELRRLKYKLKKEDEYYKLELINEAIFTKLNNGQKTRYFKNLGLSIEDVINILKDSSEKSIKEYHKAIYRNIDKTRNPDIDKLPRACAQDYIQLNRIIIGATDAQTAYIQMKTAKEYLSNARIIRKTIAQEIRQSDDVKALKELHRQIAELSKQTSK